MFPSLNFFPIITTALSIFLFYVKVLFPRYWTLLFMRCLSLSLSLSVCTLLSSLVARSFGRSTMCCCYFSIRNIAMLSFYRVDGDSQHSPIFLHFICVPIFVFCSIDVFAQAFACYGLSLLIYFRYSVKSGNTNSNECIKCNLKFIYWILYT